MEEKQKPKLEQRLALEASRTKKDIIKQYVGKDVVLELGDVGTNLSSGNLQEYDGKFVLIRDYKKHKGNLYGFCDIQNPASIGYSLPSITINVNLIASIQTLEDVLEARKTKEKK